MCALECVYVSVSLCECGRLCYMSVSVSLCER